MSLRKLSVLVLVLVGVAGLGIDKVKAQTADPVIAAAGDISCDSNTAGTTSCHQKLTSDLLIWINPTAVLTLGDNQYPSGTLSTFNTYYDPTWGRLKTKTYPSVGNHEYATSGASGYFSYFGTKAGEVGKGYYSFDVGNWHLVALNSEISVSSGSTQEQWLRSDLAANPKACTLAFFHSPRFSSGANHGSDGSMQTIWQALYDYKADVVLSGHEHNYERFAPQSPSGAAVANGIRQFVVGTGGKSLYSFGTPISNSQFRFSSGFGVLKLTLHPASYDWQFIKDDAAHTVIDSGTGNCVTTSSSTTAPTITSTTAPTTSGSLYVSPSGSDSNPGTLAQPFRTIQRAADIVNPGDTVLIRAGTYNQTLKITRGGTATSRIIFKNYPNETPIIDGVGLSISYYNSLVGIGTNSTRTNYVTLSGITIQNSPAAGINIRGNYNVLDGLKVTRSHARAIDFDNSSYSTLQRSEVTGNVLCNENGKRGCNNAPTWPINVGITNADHIKIVDNYVHGNWGEGIASWRGSHNSEIVGNTVADNWSVDVYLDHADYSTVERNLIYETESAYIDSSSSLRQKIAHGISIADENYGTGCHATNNIVRNNIIVNTRRGVSFSQYQSCSGVKNTFIEHNTIVNTWEQAVLINSGAHSGSFIRNNILYPRSSSSTSLFSGISASNNLTQDPKLVNVSASPATAENYKLTSGSSAINAGVNAGVAADYFGSSRDSQPDIGAHEFGGVTGPTSTPTRTPTPTVTRTPSPTRTPTPIPTKTPTPAATLTPTPTSTVTGAPTVTLVPTSTLTPTSEPVATVVPGLKGDADCDQKVDEVDYDILVGQFGGEGAECPAKSDFNGDGRVDGIDYVVWMNSYTAAVEPTSEPLPTPTISAEGVVTIETQVGASTDDVNEEKGVLDVSYPPYYSQVWLGDGGAVGTGYTGLRFGNVKIPAGAKIVSAKLKVFSAKGQWINMDIQIAAEASGSSLTFSDSSLPSGRQLTGAKVNHSSNTSWSANTWYELDDMKTVIQEVIDRSDWGEGNSLAVILKGTGRKFGRKFVMSWDGNPALAPMLIIVYSKL